MNNKLLCIALLLAAICGLATAATCGSAEFSILSVDKKYFYGSQETLLTIDGCFPSQDLADYTVMLTDLYPCEPTKITATTLQCRTDIIQDTVVGTDIAVDYIEDGKQAVLLKNAVSIYYPSFQYITPFVAAPVADASTFRVVVNDLPLGVQYDVFLKDTETINDGEDEDLYYKMDVAAHRSNFFLLEIPKGADVDQLDGRTFTLTLRDVAQPNVDLITVPGAVQFFNTSYITTYVSHTAPQWLPVDALDTREVVLTGAGLKDVTTFAIYHPISKDPFYVQREPQTGDDVDTKAIFKVPGFDFFNETLYPNFNASRYNNTDGEDGFLEMYNGPVAYELLNAKKETLGFSEITLVKTPEGRFFLPSTHIPANYAFDDENSYKIDIVEYVFNFPYQVPTRIKLNDKTILTMVDNNVPPQVGSFQYDREDGHDLVRFPLPPCHDCVYPYQAKACIVSEVSETCLIDLGEFTYDKPTTKQIVTFSKVHPFDGYFDDMDTYYNIYGWAWPEYKKKDGSYTVDTKFLANVYLRNNVTRNVIKPYWRAMDLHNIRGYLPRDCLIPKACPSGHYFPVVLKSYTDNYTYQLDPNFSTLPDSGVTSTHLTFNPGESWRIGFIFDTPYNPADEHMLLEQVTSAMNQLTPWQENSVGNQTTAGRPYVNIDGKQQHTTIAWVITRPPYSADDALNSTQYKMLIQEELEEGATGYFNQLLPTLMKANETNTHIFQQVFYCEYTSTYEPTGNCKPGPAPRPPKKESHTLRWVVIILIIITAAAVGYAFYQKKQNKKLQNAATPQIDELTINDASYEQIN